MTIADTLELVAGAEGLWTEGGGGPITRAHATLGAALDEATRIAGARRLVLWVHETAASAWQLPSEPSRLGEVFTVTDETRSSDGWLRLSPHTHVALPSYSGDFAGTSAPEQLVIALGLWRTLVGSHFLFSAPSSALFLIDDRRLGYESPPPGVAFTQSAFSIPAHTWSRPLESGEGERPFVQLFDRRGSYLAAWRSVELPDGPWSIHTDGGLSQHMTAGSLRPGYYNLDTSPLRAFLEAQRLPDPFLRAHDADSQTHRWLTAPLAYLATELAHEAGIALSCERVVVGQKSVRALDRAGEILANARAALDADTSPIARIVSDVIKDAYTRATAHLEYGKRAGHKLYRPAWRHTIVDRHVANTYRSLRKSIERPFIVGGVDSAIFAVAPGEWPAGLRNGSELGSWRRRGDAVPIARASEALSAGSARHLLASLIGAA